MYPTIDYPNWKLLRDAERDASGLLRFFNVIYPPVHIFTIAKELGINLYQCRHMNNDAILEFKDNIKPELYINSSKFDNLNQRFITAYVIGSIFKESLLKYRIFNFEQKNFFINKFALELLVPNSMLIAVQSMQYQTLNELSVTFNVSDNLMAEVIRSRNIF